jgi:hypothetical protein
MKSNTAYNDLEEVTGKVREKNRLGNFWAEIQFSLNYSHFCLETLKLDMVTESWGKRRVTFRKQYYEAHDCS